MSGSNSKGQHSFETAFANLPWIQREVFTLHRREGLSYREIAWLMRISERFVERQFARAIARIAKQMDGDKLCWQERWF